MSSASAFDELSAALRRLVTEAERLARMRCPHRGAGDRCHHRLPCRNQRRSLRGTVQCADDAVERERRDTR